MKTFFEDLYQYHDEANRAFMKVLSEAPSLNEKAFTLFSHILNAHQIWLDRIEQGQSAHHPWNVLSVEDWSTFHQYNQERTFSLLKKEAFERVIPYQNARGQAFTNSVQQILFHIVNHGTHHRGQIASLLRTRNIQPPVNDYIFWRRVVE